MWKDISPGPLSRPVRLPGHWPWEEGAGLPPLAWCRRCGAEVYREKEVLCRRCGKLKGRISYEKNL